MINSSFLSTQITSRQSSTLAEAKEKTAAFTIIDSLEAAESRMLGHIETYDGTSNDLAKSQENLVVIEKDIFTSENDCKCRFSGIVHDDNYELEANLDTDDSGKYQESLSILKNGNTVTYKLRRGRSDSTNGFRVPDDARKVTVTKTLPAEGSDAEPSYTITQGGMKIALSSIASTIGGWASMLPISVKVGGS